MLVIMGQCSKLVESCVQLLISWKNRFWSIFCISVLCDGRMALKIISEFLPLSLPSLSTKPTLTGNSVIKDPSLNKSVGEDLSEYCVVYRCKIEELYHLSKLQLTLRHNWLLKHKYTWRLSASEIATVTWEIFQPTSRHILNC